MNFVLKFMPFLCKIKIEKNRIKYSAVFRLKLKERSFGFNENRKIRR